MTATADAASIAGAVRRRETTAESAVGAAIDRIADDDGALNCFTAVLGDDALEAARGIDRTIAGGSDTGPLAGVPFAVKNLYDVAGLTTLAGSTIYAGNPPADADATVVAAMRRAGAVPVGALNMDEFAFGFTNENSHYGATRNPRDPERSPGGSSGASAAAVAAGMVPVSFGSDTNGSVRVPAALCGVYGFKPTYGRVSRAGIAPLAWSFDHPGWFARSVRDIATVFDAVHGPDDRDPVCADLPPAPAVPTLEDGIAGLRIAVAGGHFSEGGLPEVFAAVERVARALDTETRVEIPESARAVAAALLITSAEGASIHLDDIRTRPQDLDPHTRDRWVAATMIPSAWYQRAQRFRRRFRDRVAAVFADIDILIAPTTPFPAPVLGQATMVIDGEEVQVRPTLGRFVGPVSFIGLPALSVPVWGLGNLPLGVQIIAAPHGEASILRVARHLESAGVVGNG